MNFSYFTFIMAVLWSSMFIALLYLIRKRKAFLRYFGIPSMTVLYLFSAFRMAFPFEFPFTISVESYGIYQDIFRTLEAPIHSEAQKITIWQGFCIVWGIVAAVLLARTITRYWLSLKKLKSFKPVDDERLTRILAEIQFGYKRPLKIKIISHEVVGAPMSVGILHKYILLPDIKSNVNYKDDELCYILLHEYTHLRNRDQLVKLLSRLYSNIFWWNPISYLLLKDLEQTLELKCDLQVSESLSVSDKAIYMNTIIHDVQRRRTAMQLRTQEALSFSGLKQGTQIEERFQLIISAKKQPHKKQTVLLVITVTLMMILSYSIVIQSRFETPIEEIETEEGTVALSKEDVYIRKNMDGTYEFIGPSDTNIIDEELALSMVEDGLRLEER